jgi:hypothetical protein
MKLHRALISLLIPLLLFAQQAAYGHAISHLGKQPPPQERLVHSKLCDKCVGFEKLSHAATFHAHSQLDLGGSYWQPAASTYSFQPRFIAAFNSRGPPAFL